MIQHLSARTVILTTATITPSSQTAYCLGNLPAHMYPTKPTCPAWLPGLSRPSGSLPDASGAPHKGRPDERSTMPLLRVSLDCLESLANLHGEHENILFPRHRTQGIVPTSNNAVFPSAMSPRYRRLRHPPTVLRVLYSWNC